MSTEMRKYIDTFKQKLTESENLNISGVRSSLLNEGKTNFEDFINENKGGYIITGESGMNRDIFYFVNDEDGITACSKDINKRPDDLEKEKVFVDRKSAEKFKKGLTNWREDVRWYVESK